jgi:hypothetical protein
LTLKDTHEDHIVLLLKTFNLSDFLVIKRGYEELGLGGRALVGIADKHYLITVFDIEEILEVDLAAIRTLLI